MNFREGQISWNKGLGSIETNCLTCNKEFQVQKNRYISGRGKFCSWKCRWNHKKLSKNFILNEDMAELIGVIIGDGCINKMKYNNSYRISISGNYIEDKYYMENYLPSLIKKCLNKEVKPILAYNGAYIIYIFNMPFALFLKSLGIKERKTKFVKIPKEIKKDKKLLLKCIKGIGDTDFTLIFNKRNKKMGYYPRITGHFASKNLVKDLENSLKSFGFTLNTYYSNKIFDKRGFTSIINGINLDGPHNLKKWLDLIGFANQRIITRYQLWKLKGYLQPKSTLPERQKEICRLTKEVV